MRGRWRGIMTLTVVAGVLCLAPAAGATAAKHRASATPKWSAPGLVDRVAPTDHGFALNGVSCPTRSWCLAVDSDGQVLYTKHPANAGAWHTVRVSHRSFASLACPSAKLCVAGGYHGDVWVSTDPTHGGRAWRRLRLSVRYAVVGSVACPSTSLCIAVDNQGDVLSSTDPAGGARAWRRHKVDTINHIGSLDAVSCPTTHFCAAMDDAGGFVFTTTEPLGGKSAWHERYLLRKLVSDAFFGISCPTTRLCVAPDWNGNVWTSTSPLTGRWRHKTIAPGQLANALSGGVWCRSARLCAVFYDSASEGNPTGLLMTTADPTGRERAWHKTRLKGTSVNAGACPTRGMCVAVTGNGYELTSSRPVQGPWVRQARIDGYNSFTAVSCPKIGPCVAVDDAGDVLTAAHPSSSPRAWHAVRVDPAEGGLVSVFCPAANLCAAVDAKGGVLTSTAPAGGATAWQRASVDSLGSPTSIDCPSRRLCVFVDDHGAAFTSTNPTGGAAAWTQAEIDPDGGSGDVLTSVACASAKLCVAGDWSGDVLSTTNPAGGAAAWHEVNIENPDANDALGIMGASCPSATLCVLVDGSGGIITSTDPTGRKAAWKFQVNGQGHDTALQGVECSSTHFCIAFPSALDTPALAGVFTATDPTGGHKSWRFSAIDRTIGTVAGVSCRAKTTSCVVVDDAGNVIASR